MGKLHKNALYKPGTPLDSREIDAGANVAFELLARRTRESIEERIIGGFIRFADKEELDYEYEGKLRDNQRTIMLALGIFIGSAANRINVFTYELNLSENRILSSSGSRSIGHHGRDMACYSEFLKYMQEKEGICLPRGD